MDNNDDNWLFEAAKIAEENLMLRDGEPAVASATPGNLT